MSAGKIKVICVDDSALIRDLLTSIINEQPDMEVVATAPDPLVARALIKQHNPDVLTLDVEMPRMDGLEFLDHLMRLRPMPVIMVSSLTQAGSEATLRALDLGALDFVSKPSMGIRSGMLEYAEEITDKIRWAAKAKPRQTQTGPSQAPAAPSNFSTSEKLVIIGSSTGGTEALQTILTQMPANSPAIMIAQHMPGGFTKSFAERLCRLCKIQVSEAVDGERVLPGHAYIAPGNFHLTLQRSGANYVVSLNAEDPVNRHRPSVDVLFKSAAKAAGKNAIGVILTGMGKDGAQGLLEMRQAGAHTFAQDEATCVVYGMPKEAVAVGGVDESIPLEKMAEAILRQAHISGRSTRI